MNFENNLSNVNSEEVREILGKIPGWTLRWGTTLIFFIIGLLIISSSVIGYNDVVETKIVVTTKTPPAHVKAVITGKVESFFYDSGERVKKNQAIAEIRNTANFGDVILLKNRLAEFSPIILSYDSISHLFPTDLRLGEIYNYYSEFLVSYHDYIFNRTFEPQKKEINSASNQIQQLKDIISKQVRERNFLEKELELSSENHRRYLHLYEKGVVSQLQLEIESKKFLSDKQRHENLKQEISQSKSSLESLINDKTQFSISETDVNYEKLRNLYLNLEKLKNEILLWESKYILHSPINGELTLFDLRYNNQNVSQGDVVFTVVPEKKDTIIGLVSMAMKNSGKVKINQDVIIKLENYPYREWGSISGRISEISSVPKQNDNHYVLSVQIDELRTSFCKQIEFKQEMQGSAEIITERSTILQRIFYQINDLFSRNHR